METDKMIGNHRNEKKRTIVLLMALALLGTGSLYLTGNTFSSYMTEQTASGSAQIAKWDVKFKEGTTVITDSYEFDLKSTKTVNANVNVDTVAPGDTGHITLHVQGENTKVAYTYGVELDRNTLDTTMGDAKTHIDFYKDQACTQKWSDKTNTEVALASAGTDNVVDIYWKWNPAPSGSSTDAEIKAWDVIDTNAGTAANKATFKIKLTAKQKIN